MHFSKTTSLPFEFDNGGSTLFQHHGRPLKLLHRHSLRRRPDDRQGLLARDTGTMEGLLSLVSPEGYQHYTCDQVRQQSDVSGYPFC